MKNLKKYDIQAMFDVFKSDVDSAYCLYFESFFQSVYFTSTPSLICNKGDINKTSFVFEVEILINMTDES